MNLVQSSESLLQAIFDDENKCFSYEVYLRFTKQLNGEKPLAHCLEYLCGHHLISSNGFRVSVDDKYSFYPGSACKITAAGIDLILKGNGKENLTDKINVINVNISTDTLTNLAMIIESSKLPPEQKETLLSKLKEHGAKELITQAISSGMSNSQNIIYLFENFLK